jgi:hypothetical protein
MDMVKLILSIIKELVSIFKEETEKNREKTEEGKIYYQIRNTISRRKENPEYEIEVSLRSLMEQYPLEDIRRLKNVLKRLSKDNLFDIDKSNLKSLFFVYMGKVDKHN